ncbi:hypothetical protein BsWGS_19773 [Bradybaena similaris]
MYFKASSAGPFLLKGWSLQSVDGLLAAVIVTIGLTVVRECLAYSLYAEERIIGMQRKLILRNVLMQTRRAGLHMLNTAFAYTLMLGVMTYNFWLLVLVSLSAGFSYFFFRLLIERACRNSQRPSDQQPKIALVTSSSLSQECYVNSQTKRTGRDESRSIHEQGESGNREFLVLNPRLLDNENHTENRGGDSSKQRAKMSQPKATFTEGNKVAEGKNRKRNGCQ